MHAPLPLGPIFTAHLFPTLDARLIDLLRSLTPDDWERQTVAPKWTVKDIAAHLLDTQLRKLSFGGDGYTLSPPPVIASDRDLVEFINRLNAEGVTVYRRLSAPVLIAWMEETSGQAARYYASLDPFAPARISVSWAGESSSVNWFDTARELTERWHHQQQIRLAVDESVDSGPSGIMTPELYHPVLDCFMRALPFHYRSMPAPTGTAVTVHVSGDCGGDWHLYRGQDAWMLVDAPIGAVAHRRHPTGHRVAHFHQGHRYRRRTPAGRRAGRRGARRSRPLDDYDRRMRSAPLKGCPPRLGGLRQHTPVREGTALAVPAWHPMTGCRTRLETDDEADAGGAGQRRM